MSDKAMPENRFTPAPEWASPYEAALLHQNRQLMMENAMLRERLGQIEVGRPSPIRERDFETIRSNRQQFVVPSKITLERAASWFFYPDQFERGYNVRGEGTCHSDSSKGVGFGIHHFIAADDLFNTRSGVVNLLGMMMKKMHMQIVAHLLKHEPTLRSNMNP